ncbi:MAG: alpha/beta hydrolase [Lentisphaerae bacterium]|nr:alpha/beta hydrolase [Lentisphaerota bacterium]
MMKEIAMATLVAGGVCTADATDASLPLTQVWDKTFSKSGKVEHSKVTFKNRFGITLAADVYKPKVGNGERGMGNGRAVAPRTPKLPAIAVSGPFGAVKEQSSGLYAQTLAERGFLTIAFDPSFTGESGGEPRYVASPDINTEDFQAAVDYLISRDDVDADKIGILGICGWGGLAINAAAVDTRVKATVASTMYDMTRVTANGYFDKEDSPAARKAKKEAMNAQRIKDFKSGTYELGGGVPDKLPDDAPQFVKDYYAYYKTPRGYHVRSLNSNGGWNKTSFLSFINAKLLAYAGEIENAVMVLHGEKAHSRYFGEDAFKMLKGDNKELVIVPGASHCDLYDGGGKGAIPFDRIETFYRKHLK